MLVREAVTEDYEAVVSLLQFLNPDDAMLSESAGQSVFSNILESDNFIVAVAELDNTIAGTCYLNVIPNLTRLASPYALIENVITHPDYRRRGVGRALISNALQRADDLGCYKVMLLTGRDQQVHKFYESCGMQSGTKMAFVTRFDTR